MEVSALTDAELDQALLACSKLEPMADWLSATRTLLEKEKRRKLRARWIRGGAALALLVCAAFGAAFRDSTLSQLVVGDSKLQMQIDTRVSPISAKLRWIRLGSGVGTSNGKWTSRYVYDPRTETVRGYEFQRIQLPRGRYRFDFRALTQDPRPGLPARYQGYRWVGVGSIPTPIEVSAGETIEVELVREVAGKVYDELRVVLEP